MGDVRDPETDQVAPIPNDSVAIQDLLIEDIRARKEHGIRKYGTPVQAFNGRDMLLDAYEEVQDLAVYLRGALEEAKSEPIFEGKMPVFCDWDHNMVMGTATAVKRVDGTIRFTIDIRGGEDVTAIDKLMATVELKALGFSGIKREVAE